MDKAILYLVIFGAYCAGGIHVFWASKDKDNAFAACRVIFAGVIMFLLHQVALGLFNG